MRNDHGLTIYSRWTYHEERSRGSEGDHAFAGTSVVIYRRTRRWSTLATTFSPPPSFFVSFRIFFVGFDPVPVPGGLNPRTICNFPLGMPRELRRSPPRVPRGRRRGKRRRVQDKSRNVSPGKRNVRPFLVASCSLRPLLGISRLPRARRTAISHRRR